MNVRKGFARLAHVTALAYWAVAIIALGVMAFFAFQHEGAGRRVFRVDFSAAGDTMRACRPRFDANGTSFPCDRTVERAGQTFTFPFDATDEEVDRALRNYAAEEQAERERMQQLRIVDPRLRALARARAAREAAAARQRLFVARRWSERGDRIEFDPMPTDGATWQRYSNLAAARDVPHIHVWGKDGRAALDTARAFCGRPVACGEFRGGQVPLSIAERLRYTLNQIWQPALIWLAVYLALWAIFRAIRYVARGFMEKSATMATPNDAGPTAPTA